MKILVTGATGFIGKSLIPYLLEDDHRVFGISKDDKKPHLDLDGYTHYYGDLADYKWVRNIFRAMPEPHVIVHLASHSTTLLNKEDPSQVIDNNIKATYNLAEHAPPRCKFIFASSIAVYGDFSDRRKESHQCSPISIYAMSKLASERILDIYCYQIQKLSRPIHLRMCAVIGPEKGLTHGAVYDFCKKLRSDSDYLELLGEYPGSKKPFINIYDVIQAIKLSITDETMFGPYNVCLEDEIDIEQTAQEVCRALEIHKEFKWLGQKSIWKCDNPIMQCYNSKLKQCGWSPRDDTSQLAIFNGLTDV